MSSERWEFDSRRSGIQFSVRHLVLSKTRGRFGRWSGTAMVPDGDLSRATVDVVIDASSIHTGIRRRDDHLRSPDYLDVGRYPTITFRSRRVITEPDGRLRLVGSLTIRRLSREVTLDIVPNGCTVDALGNERAGFLARTSVDRRRYGFTGNPALDSGGLVIGERIDVEIAVEAVRKPAARAA